jgi:hypothetical protein
MDMTKQPLDTTMKTMDQLQYEKRRLRQELDKAIENLAVALSVFYMDAPNEIKNLLEVPMQLLDETAELQLAISKVKEEITKVRQSV